MHFHIRKEPFPYREMLDPLSKARIAFHTSEELQVANFRLGTDGDWAYVAVDDPLGKGMPL